jgi:hypothetical protein
MKWRLKMNNKYLFWAVGLFVGMFISYNVYKEIIHGRQQASIVNSYTKVPNYQAFPVGKGENQNVFVLSNQNGLELSYLSKTDGLRSVQINGVVYQIYKTGGVVNYPYWNWYNVQIPQEYLQKILDSGSFSRHAGEFVFDRDRLCR